MIYFFDILKSIYSKSKIDLELDIGMNIALCKWLSYDTDNLPYLARIVPFLYYMAPKRFFYLLYTSIPPKPRTPFLKRILKEKVKKEGKLYEKIQYVLGWSKKELDYNKPILNKIIKVSEWKRKLGLK